MSSILRYGIDSSVQLNVAGSALVGECGQPRSPVLEDVGSAVAQCVRRPLDYPPLGQCITPADRVVLVLEPGLPQVDTVVAEVVRCLAEAGLAIDGLTVLRSEQDDRGRAADPGGQLPKDVRDRVTVTTHDPTNRQQLAYLAMSRGGSPILLNRAITDGDLVIPIGRARNPAASDNFGMNGVVFPFYSDPKTHLRFRLFPAKRSSKAQRLQLIEQCDEVGWLLGVTFAIQVVPGPGDSILHVLAGEIGSVGVEGQRRYEEAWRSTVASQARMVVAAIEGGESQQTWENVGTALEMASTLVTDGGAMVVCSDLATEPGPGIRRLLEVRSRRRAIREIRREYPEDLLPAIRLARALDRGDVYLLSRLDPGTVEDLDIAPVAETQELVRLTQRCGSCILISNAPQAMVTIAEN